MAGYRGIHATLAEVIHHTDRQKPELATFSVLSRCLCCHLTSIHTPFPFTVSPNTTGELTSHSAPSTTCTTPDFVCPSRCQAKTCPTLATSRSPARPVGPTYLEVPSPPKQAPNCRDQHGNPASVTSHKFTRKMASSYDWKQKVWKKHTAPMWWVIEIETSNKRFKIKKQSKVTSYKWNNSIYSIGVN